MVYFVLFLVVVVILTSLLYFLDSTCKWHHIAFSFLCMTYFTEHSTLQVLSGCCQWQHFLLFMTEYYSGVHHIFVCSSVDVHSGCIHVLTTASSAATHGGQHASLWVHNFSEHRILGLTFSSRHFKYLTIPSAYIVWVRGSWVCSFKGKVLFSSSFFQDFFPYLWFSAGCKWSAWLCFFFFFSQLQFLPCLVFSVSWIDGLVSDLNLGRILGHCCFKYFLVPLPQALCVCLSLFLSLFSFWHSLCACFLIFWSSPRVLGYSVPSPLPSVFSLCFSVFEVFIDIFLSSQRFSSQMWPVY